MKNCHWPISVADHWDGENTEDSQRRCSLLLQSLIMILGRMAVMSCKETFHQRSSLMMHPEFQIVRCQRTWQSRKPPLLAGPRFSQSPLTCFFFGILALRSDGVRSVSSTKSYFTAHAIKLIYNHYVPRIPFNPKCHHTLIVERILWLHVI